MNVISRSLPFVILSSGFLGLLGFSSLRKDPPSSARTEQAPLVETIEVKQRSGGFAIRTDGEVIPYREINLASQVRGRIVTKTESARAGNFVRKDDILFEIERKDYELELKRLQQALKQASASIEESDVEKSNISRLVALAEESLGLQSDETDRIRKLLDRQVSSRSELEATKRLEIGSKNSLQTLKNQILLIEARRNRQLQEKETAATNLELASLNLERTTIRSPLDGLVTQDMAEQDDYVQVGAPLCMLEDTTSVEVRFSLRQEQLRWIWNSEKAGIPARNTAQYRYELPKIPVRVFVEIDGYTFFWPAIIDRYDGAGISSVTRTAPVIAIVEDPSAVQLLDSDSKDPSSLPAPPALLRGTFVNVEIPVGKNSNLVTIPTRALRPGGRVWAYEDGKLAVHNVQVAHAGKDEIVLLADTSHVALGDAIIVSPLPFVVNGMELRTDETTDAADGATVAASDHRSKESL